MAMDVESDELNSIDPSKAIIAELTDDMEDVSGMDDPEHTDVDYEDDPEHPAIKPDTVTQSYLQSIAANKSRFMSAISVIDCLRPTIIALKDKFNVRRGHEGDRIYVDGRGMYWNEYCQYMFGITAHRMNQLLQDKDKEPGTVIKKPDCEKPLFQKGYKRAVEELTAKGMVVPPASATEPEHMYNVV